MPKRLLFVGGDTPTTWMVYNALIAEFGLFPAVIERPLARKSMLKTRLRKVGLARLVSQMGFVGLIRPVLKRRAAGRLKHLRRKLGLETIAPLSQDIHHVNSVNSTAFHDLAAQLCPDVVIINGTRILSKQTLHKLDVPVLNMHQGITPGYRGAHGAYWALTRGDTQNCGATIHLVDKGIDTGNIIAQMVIAPEKEDNFVTYPHLQTAHALEAMVGAVRDAIASRLETKPISGASMVWYHPGFFEYLGHAMRGVK